MLPPVIRREFRLNLVRNLRFLKALRASWLEYSARDELRKYKWDGGNRILVPFDSREFYPIYCADVLTEEEIPESRDFRFLRAHEIFRHMAFAFYMRKEVENFIKFAKGCSNFVDVGAAEGFYSALFASINGAKSRIISIDGCVGCQAAIRERIRACNLAHHEVSEWRLVNAYLTGDDNGKLFEPPPGVEARPFTDVMSSLAMTPDFIKFDIESSEYEILLSKTSTEWLKQHKPTLMIELHNLELKRRGLSCGPILDRLKSIGYRVVAADTPFYKTRGNTHVILQA